VKMWAMLSGKMFPLASSLPPRGYLVYTSYGQEFVGSRRNYADY
jgi:hypothetical protein